MRTWVGQERDEPLDRLLAAARIGEAVELRPALPPEDE